MPLLTLKTKLIILLGSIIVLSLAGWGAYFYGYDKGYASYETKNLKATIEALEKNAETLLAQQARFNESISALNTRLDNQKQTVKVITTNTEREISKPVYTETVVPDTGIQLMIDNANKLNAIRQKKIAP